MAAKLRHNVILCALLSITMTSNAGLDRFWMTNDKTTENQLDECDSLDKEQQHVLITTYQSIRDEEAKLDLKKRMEWFCQLPDEEQQRMRTAWQNMSSSDRRLLKEKLQATTDAEKRTEIRRQFIQKYSTLF